MMLIGVLMWLVFLSEREVAAQWIVDGRVAGLLALGEVTAVLLLEGIALFLLASGEAAVLVVVVLVVVVLVVVMTAMVVTMAVVVVGLLAHGPGLQRCVYALILEQRSRPNAAALSASGGPPSQQPESHLHGQDDGGDEDAENEREGHVRPLEAER